MFWSEHDAEQIARASWLWDVDHKLTVRSYDVVADQYRARAAFIVEVLNAQVTV